MPEYNDEAMLRVSRDTHKKIKVAAAINDMTIGGFVDYLYETYKRRQQEEKAQVDEG